LTPSRSSICRTARLSGGCVSESTEQVGFHRRRQAELLPRGAAERRLRHVQLLGCLAEVQAARHRDEYLQCMGVEFSHDTEKVSRFCSFRDGA
jgi:hypothetical protein